MSQRSFAVCFAFFFTLSAMYAQAPKPEPDVLIFTNGDKLVGQLESAAGGSVTFKSDMVGEIKVDFSKIKELHGSEKFAVIAKGVKILRKNSAVIPQGTITVADSNVVIGSTPPQTVPVTNIQNVVTASDFQRAIVDEHGFFTDWNGTVTAGASLVEATQNSRTFTGSINLVRAEPAENWLDARSRTLVNFTESYGTVSQPDTPTLKTSIYHGGLEYDRYFSPRVYAFGEAALDHNFSQGLDLQQTYGGGIGWTVVKNAKESLDLKGSVSYINQEFAPPGVSQSLIGSTFAETYMRKLMHGIVFNETMSAVPAWNNTSAYSAIGTAGLTLPTYKRLGVSLNATDAFLNDPPVGFKKNSFQFTLGLTYSLK